MKKGIAMPVPPKYISPEAIAEARRLYTQTKVPVEDICTFLGIGTCTFHKRLKQWKWPMRSKRIPTEQPPPADDVEEEPERVRALSLSAIDPARMPVLLSALQEIHEQQIAKLQKMTARLGDRPEELPRVQDAMRAAASAHRMLRESMIMQHLFSRQSDARNDEFPRSDEELRNELLGKLDALVAEQSGEISRKPDTGST
jgi:hypothetical protein